VRHEVLLLIAAKELAGSERCHPLVLWLGAGTHAFSRPHKLGTPVGKSHRRLGHRERDRRTWNSKLHRGKPAREIGGHAFPGFCFFCFFCWRWWRLCFQVTLGRRGGRNRRAGRRASLSPN